MQAVENGSIGIELPTRTVFQDPGLKRGERRRSGRERENPPGSTGGRSSTSRAEQRQEL